MEVKVAKTAGFCFGVKRAVEKAYEVAESTQGPVYTYGPIIHNEEVVRDLEERGVRVLESEEDLKKLESGTVIIRSHGVPASIYELLEQKNIAYVDVTSFCFEDSPNREKGKPGRKTYCDCGKC